MLSLLPRHLAWVHRRRHPRLFLLFRQPILTGHGGAAIIAGMEGAMYGSPALISRLHTLGIAGIPVTGVRIIMDGSGLKVAGAEVECGGDVQVSPRRQAIIEE